MPVPKQRNTKSRRDKRRNHIKLKKKQFSLCPKCKEPVLAHHVCSNCGYYKGKEVINVMAKLDKKQKKEKEKEIKEKEKGKSKGMSMEDMSQK